MKTLFQIGSAALIVASIASSANASPFGNTILLGFDTGQGYHSSIQYDGGGRANGTWEENGFSVDWSVYDAYAPYLGVDNVFGVNDEVFFSDQQGIPYQTTATINFSRPDGLTFSLDQFEIPSSTASSWRGEATFTPYAADGSLDYSRRIFESFEVVYHNLLLTGLTTSGSLVEVAVNTFLEDRHPYSRSSHQAPDGDGIVSFAPGQLANLTSLELQLGWYSSGIELLQQSIAASNLDPLFQTGFAQCQLVNARGDGCSFAGFGEFDFLATSGHQQNWGSAVALDNFQFSLSNDTPDIASMPLPSSALFLGAGLLGMGAIGRLRSKGQRHTT